MGKKIGIITFQLVEEAEEKNEKDLEAEIESELKKSPSNIPWMKKIEKVTVL